MLTGDIDTIRATNVCATDGQVVYLTVGAGLNSQVEFGR